MEFLLTSCLLFIENTSPVYLARDDVSLEDRRTFKKCLENSGFPLSKPASIWRNSHGDACLLAHSFVGLDFPKSVLK